jgi:hypothetical protein
MRWFMVSRRMSFNVSVFRRSDVLLPFILDVLQQLGARTKRTSYEMTVNILFMGHNGPNIAHPQLGKFASMLG